ncbi:MAG TPA: hypothetical protein VF487_11725 [Chitinophagaceae bacterium]
MNTQHSPEEKLWEYIDGISSPDEKTMIEQLLQNDAVWKAKYQELMEINQLLQSSDLEAPSMRFTKNVMEEITKLHIAPATKSYINNKIIWGLGIFFIIMIVGFLIYGFGQVDWTVQNDTTITDKLGKIDYSKFFNNTLVNVFMMINVVLGLFLLDNYLSNKRKQYRKEM